MCSGNSFGILSNFRKMYRGKLIIKRQIFWYFFWYQYRYRKSDGFGTNQKFWKCLPQIQVNFHLKTSLFDHFFKLLIPKKTKSHLFWPLSILGQFWMNFWNVCIWPRHVYDWRKCQKFWYNFNIWRICRKLRYVFNIFDICRNFQLFQ